MTAFRFDENDPRIQRKIRNIVAGGDNYASLVRSLLTKEAGAQMDKYVASAKYGADKDYGDSRLALGEKSLALSGDTKIANIASRENIAKAADLTRKKTTLDRIASRQGIDEDTINLKRAAFDYDKSQVLPSALISGLGVPLEYLLNRQEKEELKSLRRLRDRRPINNYDPPPEW